MVGFRTKTPFGYGKYLRASFYTGTNVEQADTLAAYMRQFQAEYQENI
jgi:phosphoserine aminotransferase